jgi:hypothetical protein
MKRRTILCVDQNEIALTADQCEDQHRPKDVELCSLNLPECSDDDMDNDLVVNDDYDRLSDNEIPDTI